MELLARKSYKKNPGSGTEGYLNQLRLSTLYFSRLAATGKRFEIGVEVATAGKFDDIVMYLVDERQYCLVQAKHKQDESKRITLDDLLKTTTEYSLPKYFDSFLGLQQEDYCRDGQLRYIVIYTNLNVDEHVMKVIERVHQSPIAGDTFLDTLNVRCNGKEPTLYRFNTDNNQFIESLIDRISPICEVARKLAEQLVQRKKISINPNGVFHEFHALLARDVFDLDRQLFREDFLAGGLSGCVDKFRHLLERTLRAMLKLESDFSITDLNALIGAGKLKLLFEPGFLCKPPVPSSKEWADYRAGRTEVVEFFQHLILAADQPNFIELEAITKVEVFGLREYVDECMQVVFDQVDRWIRDGEGVFLGATEWHRICDDSWARITGKKWLLKSEEYQKTNPATGYLFERNSLLGPVEEFLRSAQHDTLLLVAAYKAEVSAARMLQVLGTLRAQFVVFDAHCFRDIEDLESCIPFVRHLSADRLIVVVFGEQCCQSVTKNVRYKFKGLTKAKTVYIIAASGQDWLEEIKLVYRDVFELADMATESRRQLLEKKIRLQTREVRLVDVMSEDDALQLLDMEIISQLLTNQLDPVAYSFKYQRALQGRYFARTLRSDHSWMDEAEFDRLVPCNRVVILSDGPGMGKTTFLQRFIDRLSSALPDHVICLMHLKFYTETIEEITQLNADTLSVEDAIWHVTKCFFAESTRFGQVLFRNAILNTGKLIVLVDGYDSVIWRYKKSVVRACQLFLRPPFQIRNLLLATRPHELDYLRGALPSAKIVSLSPFGELQCVKFLSHRLSSSEDDHSEAYRLLRHLAATYGDWVAGNPFQLKLLADLYQQRPDAFRCFGGLLELYLERQFYASNQRAIQIMGIGQQRMAAETLKRAAHDSHRELASALTFFPGRPVHMAPFTYLLDIGMIIFEDGRVRFEHRVVQEYFAAEALMVRFDDDDQQLRAVLADPGNRFLHRFLDYHLAKEKNAPYRDRFRRYTSEAQPSPANSSQPPPTMAVNQINDK